MWDNEEQQLMAPEQRGRLPAEFGLVMEDMRQTLVAMANMVKTTNERIGVLEQQVRLLTKVTPAQAKAIHEAIRARAEELCQTWLVVGKEKTVASAIRRAVRLSTGVSSMKDLPRCDFSVVVRQIQLWDDYKVMKTIKAKA